MKKFFAVLLGVALLFASCGDTVVDTSSVDTPTSSEEITSSEEVSSEIVSSEEITSSEEVYDNVEVDLSVPLLERDLSTTKRVRILPMGDSFTEFYPSGYRYHLYELLYRNGNYFEFVGTLTSPDERLGESYIKHEGTSGYRVSNAIEIYKNSYENRIRYDVLISFYGINDVATEANIPEFKDNYRTFLDMVFLDNPSATVYLVGAPKEFTAKATEEIVNEYKQKGLDITYINMYQREDVKFETADYLQMTCAKGHASESGNKKFAEVVFDVIKDKITELNKQTGTKQPKLTAVEKVTLSATNLNLKIGEEYEFVYEIKPSDADTLSVRYYTSNPKAATVDQNGLVLAKGEGETTITAVSLDGKAKAECVVKVSGETFEIPKGEEVFKEKFVDAEYWDGDTYQNIVEPKLFTASVKWADSNVNLTTKEEITLKENLTMEFTYCAYTYMHDTTDDYYSSFKLGNYEIRLSDNAKNVYLYANNRVVGEYHGTRRIYKTEIYTLVVKNGKATVYRGNYPLFTVDNAPAPKSGKFEFNVTHRWSAIAMDNLKIYTE